MVNLPWRRHLRRPSPVKVLLLLSVVGVIAPTAVLDASPTSPPAAASAAAAASSIGTSSSITHRATTSASSSTGALAAPAPPGVTGGDVLLARVANRDGPAATLTVPAGWTLVRDDQSAFALRTRIYVKVATAAEPVSYPFTVSPAGHAVATVSAFVGVDPNDPVDTSVGQKNGDSARLPTSPLTQTRTGALAVWFGTQVSTATTCPASSITPPAAYAELTDGCYPHATRGVGYDVATSPLGGAFTRAVGAGSSAVVATNTAQVVALRPWSNPIKHVATTSAATQAGTSVTIPTPAGAVADDQLLARISTLQNVSVTVTPPAGWTLIRSDQTTWSIRTWLFRRTATGTEPAGHTFTIGASAALNGSVSAFRGVDRYNPVDGHSGTATSGSATINTPATTRTAAGESVVWFGTQAWAGVSCPSGAISPASGFTPRSSGCHASTSKGALFLIGSRIQGSAGTQPAAPGSSTLSASNTGQQVTLRPALQCLCLDSYPTAGVTAAGRVSNPALVEPSGIAASLLNPGVYYVHGEDSPTFLAVRPSYGTTPTSEVPAAEVGSYQAGVTPWDWEDIAVGPCPAGSCVFMGDTGRNSGRPDTPASTFAIYRMPEPNIGAGQTSGTRTGDRWTFTYPGAAQDTEAMVVHPRTGQIFLISKGADGANKAWSLPDPLPAPGTALVATFIQDLPLPVDPTIAGAGNVTSADWHGCANRFLVRTYRRVYEFRGPEDGNPLSAIAGTRVQLLDTAESQGEAIAYTRDGSGYLTIGEKAAAPYSLRQVDAAG